MFPRIVIGGTQSGAGKTTLTLGLLLAARARGLKAQPFKVGPDFIDPSHHSQICAPRFSRNLDTWMCGDDAVIESFVRASEGADLSVIEGVMGLYDGFASESERGSTAHLAKLLQAPVVLVIDASHMATSAAAVALGFREFDHAVNLAGVIFNNVGSTGHYAWLKQSVEARGGIPALGYLPHDPSLLIPERHLGLVPAPERSPREEYYHRLTMHVQQTIDFDRLTDLARGAPDLREPTTRIFPKRARPTRAHIGVAFDRAFNFYYHDNLDLLRALGAEIIYYSPLDDSALPQNIDALYFGGGFPEMFARELEANTSMRAAVRDARARGMPIYAECGGLMYLCRALRDFDGKEFEMVGIVPARSAMHRGNLSLGYAEVETRRETLLARPRQIYRGQSFHWSELEQVEFEPCHLARHGSRATREGYAEKNLLATYIHAHFLGAPELAENLVTRAEAFRKSRVNDD